MLLAQGIALIQPREVPQSLEVHQRPIACRLLRLLEPLVHVEKSALPKASKAQQLFHKKPARTNSYFGKPYREYELTLLFIGLSNECPHHNCIYDRVASAMEY